MSKKMGINPMQSAHAAPRCTATSKRSGVTCRAPAVKGKRVCRMHGARLARHADPPMAGAFVGAKNARQEVLDLIRTARQLAALS